MKILKNIFLGAALMICVAGCIKQTFIPDTDNPGLSRFTSKDFNSGTCYINDTPYINYWRTPPVFNGRNFIPQLIKMNTAGNTDTLDFKWELTIKKGNDSGDGNYRSIKLRIPVKKSFSRDDFLKMSGMQSASDNNTLVLNDSLTGTANIYFVNIRMDLSGNLYASGLFNGQIGDSIFVKSGRFDYLLSTVNF